MRVSDNSHLAAWGTTWSQAKKLLETKTPENVVIARDLFLNLLVMDNTNEQGVLFSIARCESILGNYQAAVTFLAKLVSTGITDPTPIEQCDDLKNVRQTEACQTLLTLLKQRAAITDPFLQYYVSTLRCVDLDVDEMNKCKWPVREAKIAEGKKV